MGYLQSQLNLMKTWSVLKGYAANNFFYYFLGLNLHFAQDKRVTKTQCNKENEKFYSFSFCEKNVYLLIHDLFHDFEIKLDDTKANLELRKLERTYWSMITTSNIPVTKMVPWIKYHQ